MINVLFDIDETIVAIKKGLNAQASARMFKRVFNVNTNEEIVDNIAKTESWIIKAVLNKIGIKIKKAPTIAYKVWAEETKKILLNNVPVVLPGIMEILKGLSKNKDVKLSFLTGNSPWRADAKIHLTKLCNYFTNSSDHQLRGVFGNMADKRKDLLAIFKKRVNKNDKIIIIDDSLIGAKMSKLQNVPSILVATGKTTKLELQQYSKNTFDNFGDNRWKQVIKIIENI